MIKVIQTAEDVETTRNGHVITHISKTIRVFGIPVYSSVKVKIV